MPFPHRSFRNLIVIAGLLVLVSSTLAGNWPRFRGPNGTGVAADKQIPVEWTDQNVLWKVAIPGKGYSSPIVWNDRIFLQTASDDARERSLLCLDARNGQTVWTQAFPGSKVKIHKYSSYASGTPATDGERIYCLIWDGKDLLLTAHDFNGKLQWQRDLGTHTSQHGAGHSPMVHDGRLYLAHDQDGDAVVYCLDAKTGKTVWEAKRKPFRACYSTPILHDRTDGSKELLVGSTAGLTAYDPAGGKEFWTFSWDFHGGMALRTVASPIVVDGMVLQTGGDGSGLRHAIGVKLGGKGDVSQTHLAWENTRDLPYVPTMLGQGEYVYSVNDAGFAACHVARTGKEIWSVRLNAKMTASPVLIDGKIYAVADDGKVFVFAAAPEFKLLARNTIGEAVSASPAVANERLYVRGHQHLFCIGKPATSEEKKPVNASGETRVFEMRTYYANPGKMKALHARFRDHTNKLFEKHGMTMIGYWSPIDPKEAEEKMIYILAFPSKEAADKAWAAFQNDPDWKAARDASEKDGKLVKKVERIFLNPTDYSPIK